MTRKAFSFIIFATFLLSLIFTSCSHQSKAYKNADVDFCIDSQTVNEILKNFSPELLVNKSYRAADDEVVVKDESTEAEEEEEEEETEEELEAEAEVLNAPYDSIFIDVFILGDDEQQKTVLVKENETIQIKFRAIPIDAVIYAKAQIYNYTDETKTLKNIIYRGNSSSIVVKDRGNKLSISLEKAALTVTFDTDGGSAVEPVKVSTGQKVEKPEDPKKISAKTKKVNAFMGWYTSADFTELYDFNTPVTQDLTLYAKWLPDYVLVSAAKISDFLATGRAELQIPDLYVCQHEVTQAEYFEITQQSPSLRTPKGDNYPVENVSWYDAIVYCNLRSIKEGLTPCYKIKNSVKPQEWGTVPVMNDEEWNAVRVNLNANGYRLLTEAEWEYVARLGLDSTQKSFDNLVLYKDNSNDKTQTVTNRQIDELGLCNMLGNVSEWCYDWYIGIVDASAGAAGPATGTSRVKRGGDYTCSKEACSPSERFNSAPYYKDGATGFRVARAVSNVEWDPQEDNQGGSGNENGNENQGENQGGEEKPEEPEETKLYTIKYVIEDVDEGKLIPSEFKEDDAVVLPTSFSREGYLFDGWFTSEDFAEDSKISSWNSKEKSEDITVFGKWTPITYTIRFNKGKSESTAEMPPQTFTYDKPQELSECIFEAPTGLKFGGWINLDTTGHDDDELERDYSDKQEILNLTSDNGTVITLYALWVNKDRGSIKYMIDGTEVSGLSPSSYLPSESIELPTATKDPTNLTRTGYTFSGWFTDSGYNSATAITGWASGTKEGDIPVYGKFEPVTYTITYNGAGTDWTWASGYNTYPNSYTVEDAVSLPASEKVNKDYYHLYGWYFDSALTQPAAGGWEAGKTGDVNLYAKFDKIIYTINYYDTGTTVISTTGSCDVDNPCSLRTPTRTGYAFNGWYTNTSFTGTSYAASTDINFNTAQLMDTDEDRIINFYAKWSSAGVGVTVTDPDEKISLSSSAPDSSGVITFTATTDLSANFTWYVDGEDASVTGNTFTFNKITHPKGLYTITVECGGYSVTQTVIAAIGTKLSPTDVLDIVFTDGSAIAYESGLTLTNDQKAAVVAIIFYKGTVCSNDSRTRMLGLGIKNSGTTKYEWALQDKKCYTQKLTDIVISKDESAPTDETPYCEYTSTSGTTSYLSGDMDGSDNWQIIKNIATDEGETSSLAENYPIFNYANTYASTANLTGTDYSSGWYIPSLIELYQVHKKWSQLNSILSLVGGDDLGENRYYWSSSQYVNGNNAEYDYWSWSLVIKGGEIYGNNKDATRSALCIREF